MHQGLKVSVVRYTCGLNKSAHRHTYLSPGFPGIFVDDINHLFQIFSAGFQNIIREFFAPDRADVCFHRCPILIHSLGSHNIPLVLIL